MDCSKGTYVRSLIDDVGQALGVGANMTALVRTRVGHFGIEMARVLGELLP
jgi:tRNA pseudouridine55 synthase